MFSSTVDGASSASDGSASDGSVSEGPKDAQPRGVLLTKLQGVLLADVAPPRKRHSSSDHGSSTLFRKRLPGRELDRRYDSGGDSDDSGSTDDGDQTVCERVCTEKSLRACDSCMGSVAAGVQFVAVGCLSCLALVIVLAGVPYALLRSLWPERKVLRIHRRRRRIVMPPSPPFPPAADLLWLLQANQAPPSPPPVFGAWGAASPAAVSTASGGAPQWSADPTGQPGVVSATHSKLSMLLQTALALGLPKDRVDAALDHDAPRLQLTQLIASTRPRLDVPRADQMSRDQSLALPPAPTPPPPTPPPHSPSPPPPNSQQQSTTRSPRPQHTF